MTTWRIKLSIALCLAFAAAGAQTLHEHSSPPDSLISHKLITNARLLGVGTVNILDTYLSEEKYTGMEWRYMSHTVRERTDSPWSRMIIHQANFANAHNRAKNGNKLYGAYTFQYALHHSWTLLQNCLNLKAGAMLDASLGFIYNTRNSNNPAQALCHLDLAPSLSLSYRFKAFQKHPCSIQYQVSAPLGGIMFSPNYGQSYYETFTQGNYERNIVPTYPFNKPSLRQLLTFDFMFAGTRWRIGYAGNYQQSHVNHIKAHTYSHTVMIGVVKSFKFIKVKP